MKTVARVWLSLIVIAVLYGVTLACFESKEFRLFVGAAAGISVVLWFTVYCFIELFTDEID